MELPKPWFQMVKEAADEANIKPQITPPNKMEEGIPIAEPDKPTPDRPEGQSREPSEFLEKEKKEVENAKKIVKDIWNLLTGEASEGGYKEVKSLLDAIKALEAFISVEETGQLPKGTKASLNYEEMKKDAAIWKQAINVKYADLVTEFGEPKTEEGRKALLAKAEDLAIKDRVEEELGSL